MTELESFNIKQLHTELNIPVKTLRDWVYKHKIPFHKLNGVIRFNKKEIKDWYEANKVSNFY